MALKIAAIAIVSVVSALVVRSERSDIAAVIGIAGGAAVLLGVIDGVTGIASVLTELAEKTGAGGELVAYMMKIAGAGYIIEFACGAAEEAKMPSLSGSLSLAGKIVLLCMTIPVLVKLIEIVSGMLSGT